MICNDLFTCRFIAVRLLSFSKTKTRFWEKKRGGKKFGNSYGVFSHFASAAREKAFPDPRIFLRARGLYGPMHSRIAFPVDSYVAALHNRYVRTYGRTYVCTYIRIWELRVESTTIGEQLTRCPTDQSVLSVVEPVAVVRRAISKIAPRHTMTTGSDIAGRSTSDSA